MIILFNYLSTIVHDCRRKMYAKLLLLKLNLAMGRHPGWSLTSTWGLTKDETYVLTVECEPGEPPLVAEEMGHAGDPL